MIEQFDKTLANGTAQAAIAHLRGWADENGLKVEGVGGSFDAATFTLKVRFTVAGANPAADAFRRYAATYGLEADDLGKRIEFGGKAYTITGLDTKRRARPIVMADAAGKATVWKAEDIYRLLGRSRVTRGAEA